MLALMKTNFYDIESLDNVFSLCNYKADEKHIDVYYLCDDQSLVDIMNFEQIISDRIYEKNKNFKGSITFYDLKSESGSKHLGITFGLCDTSTYDLNNKNVNSPYIKYCSEFKLTKDTDPNYNEDLHPYLLGYNSYNYDTTMLTMFLYEAFPIFQKQSEQNQVETIVKFMPPSAKQMRAFNDELFLPEFKQSMSSRLIHAYNQSTKRFDRKGYSHEPWCIRKNMLLSGRHLDVARLNEKQQKVGLKRLLGMLGYQILESDKLSTNNNCIENIDQLADLIAYNVSDVVNLELLFNHKVYQGQFRLKKGLLKTYPELVYEQKLYEYKPDTNKIRRDRLTIDSSSAQFAAYALCPYDKLEDIEAVSFMYPAKEKAQELGITPVNVLDECKKFFYNMFPQPNIRAEFDRIYAYYKTIEGKNFNASQFYKGSKPVCDMKSLPKVNTNVFYYNKDGTPSSCFVTFSTGGIHGAEYNKALYDSHMELYKNEQRIFNYVKYLYPEGKDLKAAKTVTLPDGSIEKWSKFLKSGATLNAAEYKTINEPALFAEKDGSYKLNPKYTYTSADAVNHEDFESYYPNLLRMMMAFFNNGLGYDRYAEIFDDKQKYGKLMKDKNLTEEEREMYDILRDGTKLILNAATGAADANFENSIRMNNQIISMRIIGQLFSWRIGQAQTYEGARITSTNTDGLYSVLAPAINNAVLEKEAKIINVNIKPEEIRLISKDSNNRFEVTKDESVVIDAKGGTLACRKGPTPTNALAHPAIIDWALTEYLRLATTSGQRKSDVSLTSSFNDQIGIAILKSAQHEFEQTELLRMFQNITASSTGSMNYIFATKDDAPNKPIILQHYNRVFIMKDLTTDAVHLQAATARKITPATMKKRARNNEKRQQHNPLAVKILDAHGILSNELPIDKEAVIKKITNIEDNWYMFIENRALNQLSNSESQFIINNLDYNKYLQLLRNCFEDNWKNEVA